MSERIPCPHENCDGDKRYSQNNGIAVHWGKKHDEPIPIEFSSDAMSVCNSCGKEFRYDESNVNGLFCSRSCRGDSMRGEDNHFYGKSHTEETIETLSEKNKGQIVSKERRRKISESMSGEGNYWYGVTGEDHPMGGVTGEEHPMHGKTGKDHPTHGISRTPNWTTVEETGRKVRSNWEAEIDKILYNHDIDNEYECQTFHLNSGNTYTPDFFVDQSIVEVKGYADDYSIGKAESFMEEYPEYKYIVVGDEMPCDIHIKWEDKDRLVNELQAMRDD